MKNIIKDNQAVKSIIAIAIIAIVIIAGLVIYTQTGSSNPYWETENEFGIWQEEIIINYKDGSSQSLKILMDNTNKFFQTVKYEGQEIDTIMNKVRATAHSSDYGGVEVDINNLQIGCAIYRYNPAEVVWEKTFTYSGTKQGDIEQQFVIAEAVVLIEIRATALDLPEDTYSIAFKPMGDVRYRGTDPTGEWKEDVTLPDQRYIYIDVYEDGGGGQMQITLDLVDTIGVN